MKRLFSGALLTMVAASSMLVACSSNTATPSTTPGGASTAPSAAPQEKVKLTMGSWRTEDAEAYAKIIAEFKKSNPNIDIDFKPIKNTEYNTALNTGLQSGNGPDIIHLRPYAAGAVLADAGYLEPLSSIKGMDVFSKDTLLAATGKDGKVYGVPTVFSSTQVFYNNRSLAT